MPAAGLQVTYMSGIQSDNRDEASSDVDLLNRYFKEGDREALSELFNRHAGTAYRVALAEVENAADAEEAVQTAFLKIIRNEAKDVSHVRGWIMRIVVDTCHEKIREETRRRKRQEAAVLEHAGQSVPSEERAELISASLDAVKSLPKQYRLPIWLHHLEGWSFKEVAHALSISEQTARKHASLGIEQVRQSLAAAGFTTGAAAIPGLLASIPLAPAPVAVTNAISVLIATKAAGAGLSTGTISGTKGGVSLMAKASVGLIVAAAGVATAFVLSNGKAEETPKDPPVNAPVAEPAKAEGVSSEYEKSFGPQRDWPRFRGPLGNGVSAEKGLPVKWNAKTGENILWSTDLPLSMYPQYPYASPIVFKDRIFILLANIKPAEHKVACFNKQDGKLLWVTAIKPVSGSMLMVGEHQEEFSYANATPCTDGERVYAAFASGVVVALDYTGKVVWRYELIKSQNLKPGLYEGALGTNGLCSSPVLYKDMLIVDSSQCCVAFDRKTGDVKYAERRPGAVYASPVPVMIKGVPCLLHRIGSTVCGVDPENGKVAWSIKNTDNNGIPSLAAGDGIVYGSQGVAWSLDSLAGAKGDVSAIAPKWKYDKKDAINDGMGSPIVAGGYVCRVTPRGNYGATKTFMCFEAATGNVCYDEKTPAELAASAWTACPMATTDGLIYFAGPWKTVVIKAGPKFELVAINDLDDGGSPSSTHNYWDYNSAAMADGKIFILGYQKLWCIGKK